MSDKKNLIQRLLLFVIAVPLILLLPLLYHFNFLMLFLTCFIVMLIATHEMHRLLVKKYKVYNWFFFAFLVFVNFVLLYFFSLIKVSFKYYCLVFLFPFFFLAVVELFISQSKGCEKSVERILTGTFICVYPLWFGNFFLFLTQLNNPRIIVAMFFISVICCDSLAWFFGMLFGKNNRGLVKASPKKSVAGFIGSFISAILCTALAIYLVPKFKTQSYLRSFLIFLFTHIAATIGDLFESILKRDIGVKDSGSVVMGRGGILDSIDGMLFAAPTYFLLCACLL
ncbi:MAG: phosphatidate cytidylyltransferase [Treponemataceae bacterium]